MSRLETSWSTLYIITNASRKQSIIKELEISSRRAISLFRITILYTMYDKSSHSSSGSLRGDKLASDTIQRHGPGTKQSLYTFEKPSNVIVGLPLTRRPRGEQTRLSPDRFMYSICGRGIMLKTTKKKEFRMITKTNRTLRFLVNY